MSIITQACESVGTFRYSPKQLGDKSSPNWWLVLDCDPTIGEYYRHLYWLAHNKCRQLLRPAWKEHITLIRNEEPAKNKQYWGLYNGHPLSFFYDPVVQTDGKYYWLNVFAPGVKLMRAELGLPLDPKYPLHLTIGHEETVEAAEKIKMRFGFKECPRCGAGHRDRVLICRECAYKGGS